MKKKLFLVSVIIIVLTLFVGGTLAFFQARDEVKNTFTYGSIKIQQFEQEYNENNELVDFTQDQYLYPIVNVNSPSSDKHYVDKLVSVKNIGSNDAYVRTFIAMPKALVDIVCLDVDTSGKWVKDTNVYSDTVIDGITYAVVSYTYTQSIAKNEVTDFVLKGVYMESFVDLQTNPNTNTKQFCVEENGEYRFFSFDVNQTIDIYVASQACQVDGLGSDAIEALDTAFGKSSVDFN